MPYERFAVTMSRNLKTLSSKTFAMTWVLSTNFHVRIRPLERRVGNEKYNLV
jgi:hypothetical protein